jgi:hypothetical protein
MSFEDTIRQIIREEIQKVVETTSKQNELPPMLNRTQLKQFLQIGETKASELLNRQDFPVFREAGVLVPTHMLFKWIERNTQWLESNSKYFNKVV